MILRLVCPHCGTLNTPEDQSVCSQCEANLSGETMGLAASTEQGATFKRLRFAFSNPEDSANTDKALLTSLDSPFQALAFAEFAGELREQFIDGSLDFAQYTSSLSNLVLENFKNQEASKIATWLPKWICMGFQNIEMEGGAKRYWGLVDSTISILSSMAVFSGYQFSENSFEFSNENFLHIQEKLTSEECLRSLCSKTLIDLYLQNPAIDIVLGECKSKVASDRNYFAFYVQS